MDLDELKKLSEIFQNFAQPIATVLGAFISAMIVKSTSSSKNKKSKKK